MSGLAKQRWLYASSAVLAALLVLISGAALWMRSDYRQRRLQLVAQNIAQRIAIACTIYAAREGGAFPDSFCRLLEADYVTERDFLDPATRQTADLWLQWQGVGGLDEAGDCAAARLGGAGRATAEFAITTGGEVVGLHADARDRLNDCAGEEHLDRRRQTLSRWLSEICLVGGRKP